MEISALFAGAHTAIISQINNVLQEPYMDEHFHVTQTQRYCAGYFDYYDEKITTPPALYYFALYSRRFINAVLQWRGLPPLPCDTATLRYFNVLPAALTPLVVYYIIKRLHGEAYRMTRLHTLVVSSFPVLFFCTHLFYNEALSSLLVCTTFLCGLLAIREHPNGRYLDWRWTACSAMVGALSLFARQNNIVWVFFVAVFCLGQCATGTMRSKSIRVALKNRAACIPWVAVGIGFVVFVIINGGVVLGDKENHKPVFHFSQLCYAVFVVGLYMIGDAAVTGIQAMMGDADAADDMKNWSKGFESVLKAISPRKLGKWLGYTASYVVLGLITLIVAAGVAGFSYTHPYLLADNRHYTFYIWRRILGPSLILRVLYSVAYVALALAFCSRIVHLHNGVMTFLLWMFCTAVSVIPSQLLEPRYFILPTTVALLLVQYRTNMLPALITGLHALVNAETIYVFIHKPFLTGGGVEGRFMW